MRTHLPVDRFAGELEERLEDVTRAAVLDEAFKLTSKAVEQDAPRKVVHGVQQLFEDNTRLAVAREFDLVTGEGLECGPEEQRPLVFDLLLDLFAVVVDHDLGRGLAVPLGSHLVDLLRHALEVGFGVWIGFGQGVRIGRRTAVCVRSFAISRLRALRKVVPIHASLALPEPALPLEAGSIFLLLLFALELRGARGDAGQNQQRQLVRKRAREGELARFSSLRALALWRCLGRGIARQ